MKNYKVCSFVLMTLSTLSLANCGQKKSDPKTLSIATSSDIAENDVLSSFRRGFLAKEENQDIKINIIKITDNYDSWINNKLYVGQVPDIIQVYDYSSEFWTNYDTDGRGNGLFYPISEYFSRDGLKESDYFESMLEMTKSGPIGDNQMYWVPRDYNKVVCIYNKKIFDTAEVDYPTNNWTFNEFVNICEQLKAKKEQIRSYSKSTVFYPSDMNLNWQAVYYPMIKSYGGDLIDKEHATAFKNENAVKEAINDLLYMADNELAVPPDISAASFANKQAAMMFVSRPNIPNYVDSLGAENIDFVAMPSFDKAVDTSYIGMGCTGYGITTSCPEDKRDLAWRFLKYIISEEGQNIFSKTGSGIPVLKSLANDPNAEYIKYLPNANNKAFVDSADRDIPMNFMKGFKPEKQLGIYSYLTQNALVSFYKANRNGGSREEYYSIFKEKFEKTWK